ncbi:polymeric immunoglobulin receptor-like isoform X2 [Sander vitreus]
MAVHLRVLLILTGFTGIHSITTVSEVSVKAGSSISIPCLYGLQYINHVKYLCKGYYWHSCSYIVKTNQQNSGKFSISDDNTRRIFTVTINDLADEDTHYWCAVEINGGADVKEYFHLSVTRDTPHLYADPQEITRFNGDNITVNCYYTNTGETKWCRLGSSCVTRSPGSIDGTNVTISEGAHGVFNVTMSGLRTESSGWYWCAKGDLQMPVHVTVTERPTTITLATTSHLTTLSPTPEPVSASFDVEHFIIPLSLLIFIVMVTLLIWFMLKRHQQTRADSSATTVRYELKRK